MVDYWGVSDKCEWCVVKNGHWAKRADVEELEKANAALCAKVKELEESLDKWMDDSRRWEQTADAYAKRINEMLEMSPYLRIKKQTEVATSDRRPARLVGGLLSPPMIAGGRVSPQPERRKT